MNEKKSFSILLPTQSHAKINPKDRGNYFEFEKKKLVILSINSTRILFKIKHKTIILTLCLMYTNKFNFNKIII